MLLLDRVDVVRGVQRILRQVSLQAAPPGALFLMGGGGTGKSSLLAAIAGASGESLLAGSASWCGRPLAAAAVPTARLRQHDWCDTHAVLDGAARRAWLRAAGSDDLPDASTWPRAVRRYLAVMAVLHAPAQLYLLDEPTAGLSEAMTCAVRERLAAVAAHACVVVATHNRQDCLHVGGTTALLAGGTVQECAESRRFFSAPETPAGRLYVETGNCALPSPPDLLPPDVGMWWLIPRLLCGMSRPGITSDAQAQFRLLAAEGVRALVCAEERCLYPRAALREHGLVLHHVPIRDLAPPSFGQAVRICRIVEAGMRAGYGVAVHCRGGLGRTGTALAAALIWHGDGAEEAIAKVRAARPMAIQTRAQLEFVHGFARSLNHLSSINPKREGQHVFG